jgi:hypothetical protein
MAFDGLEQPAVAVGGSAAVVLVPIIVRTHGDVPVEASWSSTGPCFALCIG